MAVDTPMETGGSSEGGNVITRKLGPLPVWAWALIVAGAVLIARRAGGKAPTGGESAPGLPLAGDVGDGLGGSGTGATEVPGPAGAPGAPGAPGTLPTGYTKGLNDLFNWFQQLQYTTSQIALYQARKDDATRSGNTTLASKYATALTKIKGDGSAKVAGGKVTITDPKTGAKWTGYQRTWLNTTINELQTALAKITGA